MKKEEDDNILQFLPADQIQRVLNQRYCDIEPCFMGFTDIYKSLSEIIPAHFTVVDLGCAYNPQCFYFLKHKKYISVDAWEGTERFKSPNCEIFEMSIEEFIKAHVGSLDLEETFAICSYVPPWGGDNMKMVRDAFINVFTYYPHGGYDIRLKMMTNEPNVQECDATDDDQRTERS